MRALVATIIAVAIAGNASGTHWCEGGATVEVAGAYVDHRPIACNETPWCEIGSIWLYVESNGVPGLQRGGVSLLGDEDICQTPNPDQAVF